MSKIVQQKRMSIAVILGLIVAAGGLGLVATAGAQSGASQGCNDSIVVSGSTAFGPDDPNTLLSLGTNSLERTLTTPLAAGNYVINGVSYDGYTGRDAVPAQPDERWYAEFLAADSSILATTSSTGDVEDGVLESTWSGSLGSISLAAEATSVRFVHAAIGGTNPNSVRPICLGATSLSSLSVDFATESTEASSVTATCGSATEAGSGTTVAVAIPSVTSGTTCTVSYTDAGSCSAAVTPDSVNLNSVTDGVEVVLPSDAVDAVVTIRCTVVQVSSSTTTPPTTTTTIPAQVGGVTQTPSQAAVAQAGTPNFTG